MEGVGIQPAGRLVTISENTVLRNLPWIGEGCQKLHHELVREVYAPQIQADEMWSFCFAKEKNLPAELQGSRDVGDIWTWIALDPATHLYLSWHAGKRDFVDAQMFAQDLASRISGRTQISTDLLSLYREAFLKAFGTDADYAALRKADSDVGLVGDYFRKFIDHADAQASNLAYIRDISRSDPDTEKRSEDTASAWGAAFRETNAYVAHWSQCRDLSI